MTGDVDYNNSIVFMRRGNCSFYEKAKQAQLVSARAVIVINNGSDLFIPSMEPSQYVNITIPLVIIGESDAEQIVSCNSTSASMYAPKVSLIDPNAIFISLIGIILIVIGSYSSQIAPLNVPLDSENITDSPTLFVFNVKTALIYIVSASLVLVVLYFLYAYAVYLIFVVFVMGSTSGMFLCLNSITFIVDKIPEGKSFAVPQCGTTSVRSCLMFLICLSLPIIWIICRHHPGIWVLQDILGSAMILGVFRTVHLPNFKIAVVLLSLFFIYDIFFVFVTPYFTPDGKSIMVKVATGGDTQDLLPLTIIFPHFLDPFDGACKGFGFSILGFGDILIPGLVISFCLNFDYFVGTWHRKLYFLTSLTAYLVGLIATYLGLALMKSAQPALLYLVPTVLGSTSILAVCRGEFKWIWTGTLEEEEEILGNQSDDDGEPEKENVPLMDLEPSTLVELDDIALKQ
uniref:PA domain-containing protein n=1 Tax=Arcella intermedia TaxID=1963864 RepID=A0A6B2L3C9_9EUKA